MNIWKCKQSIKDNKVTLNWKQYKQKIEFSLLVQSKEEQHDCWWFKLIPLNSFINNTSMDEESKLIKCYNKGLKLRF